VASALNASLQSQQQPCALSSSEMQSDLASDQRACELATLRLSTGVPAAGYRLGDFPTDCGMSSAGPVVLIEGPDGSVEPVRLSPADSPAAVEHCLKNIFMVPRDAGVLLRDIDGCIVPLGPGLLQLAVMSPPMSVRMRLEVRGLERGFTAAATAGSFLERTLSGFNGNLPSISDKPTSLPNGDAEDAKLREMEVEVLSQALVPFERPASPGAEQTPRAAGPIGDGAVVPAMVAHDMAPNIATERTRPTALSGRISHVEAPPLVAESRSVQFQDPHMNSPPGPSLLKPSPIPSPTSLMGTGNWNTPEALLDEFEFWRRIVSEGCSLQWQSMDKSCTHTRMGSSVALRQAKRTGKGVGGFSSTGTIGAAAHFVAHTSACQGVVMPEGGEYSENGQNSSNSTIKVDTSPQHVDSMFDGWSSDGTLTLHALQSGLRREGLSLSEEALFSTLQRVRARGAQGSSFVQEGMSVPRTVFASLWQRLVLGVVCQDMSASEDNNPKNIHLIEFTEAEHKPAKISERQLLFGGHSRDSRKPKAQTTRWVGIQTSQPEVIVRLGCKFFLHPLATEDILNAVREGTTKIDRYRHQYFVSLEVYGLNEERFEDEQDEEPDEPPPVGPLITRSTLSLVATGNPPTRAARSGNNAARNMLLTVINDKSESDLPSPASSRRRFRRSHNTWHLSGHRARGEDPLDRFETDQAAAKKVLDSIREDLRLHKRQREFQADFLLYSIIDRSASELSAICNAYGRRLRWLQDRLDAGKLDDHKEATGEVSRARMELQELKQWAQEIATIVAHLETDCRSYSGTMTDISVEGVPCNFGADAKNGHKSMVVFLRHTQDYLVQARDRLSVLDDLAKSFISDVDRHKSDLMNHTLFILSVSSVIFLPAQFFAGVYGMNFQDPVTGKPAIPELNYGLQGYTFFWVLIIGLCLLIFLLFAFMQGILRCSSICRCCGNCRCSCRHGFRECCRRSQADRVETKFVQS